MRTCSTALFALSLLLAPACTKTEEGGADESSVESAAGGQGDAASEKRNRRGKRDRGEGSMKLGDTDWVATRANARVKGSTVKIKLVRSERDGDVSRRESVDLQLENFDGPGTYTVNRAGSRFIGVGLDVKKATEGDKAVEKEATRAIQDAKTMLLMGAKVEITSANDEEIVGTFEWKLPGGEGPHITEGKFRAPIRKRRKKR